MSEMPAAIAVEQAEQGWMTRLAESARDHSRELAAVTLTVVAALGAVACGGGKSSSGEQLSQAAAISANCNDLTLTNSANAFPTGKFLPAAPNSAVSSSNQAADYTKSWFGKSGPLAGTADRASLAVIDAAIAAPALQGNTNNSYSYGFQFTQEYNKLSDPNAGQAEAVKLCNDENRVIGETESYNNGNPDQPAIKKGEQYTTFTAVEGSSDITGLNLEHETASHDINGVTFEAQGGTLHGFTEVIVEGNGTIDVKGYLPTGGKTPSQSQAPSGSHKQHGQNSSGSTSSAGNGGGSRTSTGNGGGGTSGTSNGTSHNRAESPKTGPVPEHNKQGASPGPNHGKGGNTGTRPGPLPSPNTGGGNHGTTPNAPAPTPNTTPSTPTPPPETTPTPPPPTTTPTPTPPPTKGPEPPCVSNPPYVIC
jgi:hypothetical protein